MIQGNPIGTTIDPGVGYSSELSLSGVPLTGGGRLTWTTSTGSSEVTVSSSGAITVPTSVTTPGTVAVSGTVRDTVGDSGTWSFTLRSSRRRMCSPGASAPTVSSATTRQPHPRRHPSRSLPTGVNATRSLVDLRAGTPSARTAPSTPGAPTKKARTTTARTVRVAPCKPRSPSPCRSPPPRSPPDTRPATPSARTAPWTPGAMAETASSATAQRRRSRPHRWLCPFRPGSPPLRSPRETSPGHLARTAPCTRGVAATICPVPPPGHRHRDRRRIPDRLRPRFERHRVRLGRRRRRRAREWHDDHIPGDTGCRLPAGHRHCDRRGWGSAPAASTGYAFGSNGTVYAWGAGGNGELGNGTTTSTQTTPVAVSLPSGVTATSIATGAGTGYAIGSDACYAGAMAETASSATARRLRPRPHRSRSPCRPGSPRRPLAPKSLSLSGYAVVRPLAPPTITSATSTTFTQGQSGTFAVTATGTPAATFSLSGVPAWLSIDPNSGVLAGTPPIGSGGIVTFTVDATNGVSPDATQTFTLTVDEAPSITSANSTTFAEDMTRILHSDSHRLSGADLQ